MQLRGFMTLAEGGDGWWRDRLTWARVGWSTTTVALLILFAASLPAYYHQLVTISGPDTADPEATRAGLAQLGLSTSAYALFIVAVETVLFLGFLVIALIIVSRRPDEWIALYTAAALVWFVASYSRSLPALATRHPFWDDPVKVIGLLGFVAFFTLFYVFPDGQFVPGWTRYLVVAWLMEETLNFFPPASSAIETANFALFLGLLASCIGAQVYRYRRVSGPAQRQQTVWVVLGLVIAIVGFLVYGVSGMLVSSGVGVILHELIGGVLMIGCFMLIPLSIGAAIVRHRLWGIDILVNRALVYGALTAGIVGIYAGIVGGVGALVQSEVEPFVAFVATGLVAVLFQPMRAHLQRGVNHLLYGERDDPYAVLSQLGQRLDATLTPDAVLPAIVDSIAETLKLRYVAITLEQEGGAPVIAITGVPSEPALHLPLLYQGEVVGELQLAPRDQFGPANRQLLDDLARQAGIAAQAVRLAADLQHARARLVTAREEERRRLRRDLHDGLGPQLAGFTLRLDVVRRLLRHDPDAAEAVIVDLKAHSQTVVTDIRRLVHDLRPPALDDLGLVGALRQGAALHASPNLVISIEVPEALPSLPAAVEVAAYRIVQEALTNVVKHAEARVCVVRLELGRMTDTISLKIADDGQGLHEGWQAGVGFASMRERAAELGGTCLIESQRGSGTRVLAQLPIDVDTRTHESKEER